MNRFEFTETLKTFDINNPLTTTIDRTGKNTAVHYWNNCAIYFFGTYYTIVKGKIPFEIAEKIYKKYPDNKYQIRIDGGDSNWTPYMRATDDIYEKETANLKCDEDLQDKINLSYAKLKARSYKNKYIKSFHIDTLEGLNILLTEINNYYNKNKLNELEMIAETYKRIISEIRPAINNQEWLRNNKDSYFMYQNTRNKYHTTFDKMFLETIDDFDYAVNPFLNRNIDLYNTKNYVDKLNISGNLTNNGGSELTIKDINTGNKVYFLKNKGEFLYSLEYTQEKNKTIINHYFMNNKGETIRIYKYNNSKEITIYLKDYNKEDMINSYLDLISGVNMAKMITIDKMNNKVNTKKLIKN